GTIRPRLTSPDSRSRLLYVIWRRCTSNATTIAIGTSSSSVDINDTACVTRLSRGGLTTCHLYGMRQRLRPRDVVHDDKISWPTRGPNVDWTLGSTMRSEAGAGAKSACKEARSEAWVAKRHCARPGRTRMRTRVRGPACR